MRDHRGLVAVDGHALGVAAQFPVGGRRDGSAAAVRGAALLQSQQLLGTESLVVDLACRLDEILEVGAEEEVAEVDEFAVVLILHVDDAPAVLAANDLLAVDDDRPLATDNSERDGVLENVSN